MKFTRRSFVGRIGSGVAALAAFADSAPADAQLVYKHSDWKFDDFNKLLKHSARAKQVYDVDKLDEGGFLNSVKNSINGLQFGYGIPADQIKIVCALRGSANLANFNDAMWAKYNIAASAKAKDEDGKPVTRNPYLAKATGRSSDMEDRNSTWQDFSIEALMARGVQFLCCHNATTAAARGIISRNKLTTPINDLVAELQANTNPGVIVVPAMVAAVHMLQAEGHFSYITT